jgi:hypothetical protein
MVQGRKVSGLHNNMGLKCYRDEHFRGYVITGGLNGTGTKSFGAT